MRSPSRNWPTGPAPATQNMSRFGLRRFPKFTGTGFAHPKMNVGLPNLAQQQQHPRNQDRAHRVDMLDRVRRDPAQHPGRLVTEQLGDVAVRGFVQRDREDHRHRPEHDGRERKIHWPTILPDVPVAMPERAAIGHVATYSQSLSSPSRAGSPAPRRTMTGGSTARSTTVVGSAGHAPASMTRSSARAERLPDRLGIVQRFAAARAASASTTGWARRAPAAAPARRRGPAPARRSCCASGAAAVAALRAWPAAGTCTRPGVPCRTIRNCQLSSFAKWPISDKSRSMSVRR